MPETQEEWDLISPTHGNSQLEVLLDHFGNSAQSQKFKLVEGDKFHRQVNPVDTRVQWLVFKNMLWAAELIDSACKKLQNLDDMACLKFLNCI